MPVCRWCGKETRSLQVCEFCQRDLTTGATATTTSPAQAYARFLQEASEQTEKSVKFLYEVNTGYTLAARLERFFSVALLVAMLNLIFIAWRPEWSLWSNLASFLLIGVWLPTSYLIDRLEDLEVYRDLVILLVLQFVLDNPLLAGLVYAAGMGVYWLLTRADLNSSVSVVVLVYVGFRLLFDGGLILNGYLDFADWLQFKFTWQSVAPLGALIVGWFVGSLFRND